MRRGLTSYCLACVVITGCAPQGEAPDVVAEATGVAVEVREDVDKRLARYAPTELEADLTGVAESELPVLVELIKAGKLMDEIFLRQVWVGNPEFRARLAAAEGTVQTYFDVNFGPWDRLDEMEPWVGETAHPPGAGYYPVDMSAKELENWIEAHPEDREALTSLFTVVRREGDALVAVPYSEAYREFLEPAAEHLRRAAELTANDSLKTYLSLRADAFASDDYYASDLAWMDLQSPVEVTIGPYETYEDSLFGYKAAFEAFVTVDVPEESARLERFKSFLPWLEENLPIGDEDKNVRGTESPIRVVDEVFVGGDSKAGVQTLAFNLPNDERVREEKGSKKVMLRNVLRAKYEQILLPIAELVMVPEDIDRISFDAFFSESLHHELSHGLGPGKITVDGRETEVRLELKELYSTLEEAKADVMGVYNILALVGEGKMPETMAETLLPTYVAGLFRSARFGLHEAHGRGVVAQFNYLLEKGGLEVSSEGRFRAVPEVFPAAIESLLQEMLMLQAVGDYEGTVLFLDTYGVASEALVAAIARLDEVAVDIRPVYSQAEELLTR
ncbi:MAG: peptidase [Acidobacteriota bacterium]|nr:peptidase [Acidobacteriota bacterium]